MLKKVGSAAPDQLFLNFFEKLDDNGLVICFISERGDDLSLSHMTSVR